MDPKQSKKKKNEPVTTKEPNYALESHVISNIARASFEMDEWNVEKQKITQILQVIPMARHKTEIEQQAISLRALDMYQSLKPEDCLQGMLAELMVGTQFAALDALRLLGAAKDLKARECHMKQVEKLTALFLKEANTLTKLQGKDQQKVSVKQVNVAEGGQAIVGNVQTGVPKRASRVQHDSQFDVAETEVEP